MYSVCVSKPQTVKVIRFRSFTTYKSIREEKTLVRCKGLESYLHQFAKLVKSLKGAQHPISLLFSVRSKDKTSLDYCPPPRHPPSYSEMDGISLFSSSLDKSLEQGNVGKCKINKDFSFSVLLTDSLKNCNRYVY